MSFGICLFGHWICLAHPFQFFITLRAMNRIKVPFMILVCVAIADIAVDKEFESLPRRKGITSWCCK